MNSTCYACLIADADTKDHIPPQSFFPTPRPNNLITVPCCEKCNNGNSQEDDYVRFILTSLLDRSPAGEKIWEEKIVRGYMPRNPREIDNILPSLADVSLKRGGQIIEAVAFKIEHARLSQYFIRMTKGLLRHHYPSYNYQLSVFQVRFILPGDSNLSALDEIRDQLKYSRLGEGVFQYRHGLSTSGLSGVWMLVFFEAILVLVHHTNDERS